MTTETPPIRRVIRTARDCHVYTVTDYPDRPPVVSYERTTGTRQVADERVAELTARGTIAFATERFIKNAFI